jgi:predicted regulator of Ras-like GTPase activity (Roadblock/LC7/MglB family)
MNIEKGIDEIDRLVSQTFAANSAILALIIASHEGKKIYTKFRETQSFNEHELSAITASLLFIARTMFRKTFGLEIGHAEVKGQKKLFFSVLTKEVTGSVMFDRKIGELMGITEQKQMLTDLFMKISAVVETSVVQEDLFVLIKRAIPNALSIVIINKEGLPIKVESTIEEPKISAFIYALNSLSNTLLKDDIEHTVISGEYGSYIIQQIDEERILGIAVPDSKDAKLNKYIAALQDIIKKIA